MKVCHLCGDSYKDMVDFCFNDGEVLLLQDAIQPAEGNLDAPPAPRHLQGSQAVVYEPEPTEVAAPAEAGYEPEPTEIAEPIGLSEEEPTLIPEMEFGVDDEALPEVAISEVAAESVPAELWGDAADPAEAADVPVVASDLPLLEAVAEVGADVNDIDEGDLEEEVPRSKMDTLPFPVPFAAVEAPARPPRREAVIEAPLDESGIGGPPPQAEGQSMDLAPPPVPAGVGQTLPLADDGIDITAPREPGALAVTAPLPRRANAGQGPQPTQVDSNAETPPQATPRGANTPTLAATPPPIATIVEPSDRTGLLMIGMAISAMGVVLIVVVGLIGFTIATSGGDVAESTGVEAGSPVVPGSPPVEPSTTNVAPGPQPAGVPSPRVGPQPGAPFPTPAPFVGTGQDDVLEDKAVDVPIRPVPGQQTPTPSGLSEVSFESDPSGALVSIVGTSQSIQTPGTLELEAGQTIPYEVRLAGYQTITDEILVGNNRMDATNRPIKMTPLDWGRVMVLGFKGSTLFVDGEAAPYELPVQLELTEGSHRFMVKNSAGAVLFDDKRDVVLTGDIARLVLE